MKPNLASLAWPAARIGEALSALALKSGLAQDPPSLPASHVGDTDALLSWVENAAIHLGLEIEESETPYGDFESQVAAMGPALVRIPSGDKPVFLVLLPGRLGRTRVLTPDLRIVRARSSDVRAAVCHEREAAALPEIEELLNRVEVSGFRRRRASATLLRERFSATPIRGIWLLRTPPGAPFLRQLKMVRVPRRLATLAAAHAAQYFLWLVAWWVAGRSALAGNFNRDTLLAWALLLLTLAPLRVWITWLQGLVAIGAGAALKQRLFYGGLRLNPDEIRHQGAGQLLGRVLESEAVEALALSGGFLALVAIVEIGFALAVLSVGAGGWINAASLLAWIAIVALLGARYYQRNREWTNLRLAMTHDLVENMVGHRTRLAQLPPELWHDEEDGALEGYLSSSRVLDRFTLWLIAGAPRGWLLAGLLGVAPAFVRGATPARLAIAMGGILLAYRALKRLSSGLWQVAGAAVAWERVGPLFRAAERPLSAGAIQRPAPVNAHALDARELVYRYPDRDEPVLRGCSLRVETGDRIVLEGPSGGGKSTLVSLLTGLRAPGAGVLLADGFDRATLGDRDWRAHIAAAPQFHENYVLTGTFAFNLQIGRRRSHENDLNEAEALCRELGLGPLLDRMPGGILQMVGESGWQLSHGERSRLYIARALLQDASLIVLDESFAALDPENLNLALECVARRARSLLVVAHR